MTAGAAFAMAGQARSSSAVSVEAAKAWEISKCASDSYESSVALFGRKAALLESLNEAASEALEPDWDGNDAEPVNPGAFLKAEHFIRALPDYLPDPEISIDPDGDVSFEWIPSKTKYFTVTTNNTDRLAYAWIDGTDRGHAVANMQSPVIPDRLIRELEQLLGHGNGFRVA